MNINSREDFKRLMKKDAVDPPQSWQREALKIALDERGREIDLYWKRTAYSWALTAAAFAGYFTLTNGRDGGIAYESVAIVSFLGLVCAVSWYAINRGSKYWQENWEIQVDILELEITGPLHRVNPAQGGYRLWRLNQAYPFSVSKVNQLLSLFISFIWAILAADACRHLHWSWTEGSPTVTLVGVAAVLTCIAFVPWGRTAPTFNSLGKNISLRSGPIEEEAPETQPEGTHEGGSLEGHVTGPRSGKSDIRVPGRVPLKDGG